LNILEAEGLTLSFGGIRALADVSIAVPRGGISAIIGPNGAGKTSLFNAISGFYRPERGTIRFDGADITRVAGHARAALGLARTFQNVALFRGMTVLDNIKLGGHHRLRAGVLGAMWYLGRAAAEESRLREAIEREVIDFLEIDHIRGLPIDALAYGLQKRVELARALAMQPKVLMLDEPVAGMSVRERQQTAELLKRISVNRSVIVIEHDMEFVRAIAHRVTVLHQGRVLMEGSMDAVQADERVIEAYLGH